MIFSIDSTIFNSDDDSVHRVVLRIFQSFLDGGFIWDKDNLDELFVNEELIFSSKFAERMLPPALKDELIESIYIILEKNNYVTAVHEFYLSKFIIGFGEGMLSPQSALKLMTEPSKVLLENGRNDWKFIKGIVKNFKKHPKKKSIYSLVNQAIELKRLVPENAGGSGEILNILREKYNDESELFIKLKLSVLFDSDRNTTNTINQKWKNLLCFLKNVDAFDENIEENLRYQNDDKLYWHMLYKREIENYIPLNGYGEEPFELEKKSTNQISTFTANQHDFFNFGTLEGIQKNSVGDYFLKDGLRDHLYQRCSHHLEKHPIPNETLEDVSEIDKILLMLVKLI